MRKYFFLVINCLLLRQNLRLFTLRILENSYLGTRKKKMDYDKYQGGRSGVWAYLAVTGCGRRDAER